MRTLGEIIELSRSGKHPEYDELRYAVCAMDALMMFDQRAIDCIADGERKNKKPFITSSAIFQQKENFRRVQNALGVSPKKYIGWNNDPKNPEFLERRESSKRIYKKIAERVK